MKRTTIIYIFLALYIIGVFSGMWLIFVKGFQEPRAKIFKKGIRFTPGDAIAIIKISGPIRLSQRPQRFLSYDASSITRNLRGLSKKEEVKAVILRINSPGGSVAAVQEIYSETMKLREKGKIVIASMGDVAASGGYYIASACDKIVANPGTLTGSIGVLLELPNVQELFKKIGVKIETIKTGRYKDSGSSFRELTLEERRVFQELVNEAYNQFIEDIVKGRNMNKQKVIALADGRVFTGTQALKEGLIDMLGSDAEAIELAKKLANIKGKPRIIRETDPWERIFSIFGEQTGKMSLTEIINNMRVRLEYMME